MALAPTIEPPADAVVPVIPVNDGQTSDVSPAENSVGSVEDRREAKIDARAKLWRKKLGVSLAQRWTNKSNKKATITVEDIGSISVIERLKEIDPELLSHFIINAKTTAIMDKLNALFNTDANKMPTHLIGDLEGLSPGDQHERVWNQILFIKRELDRENPIKARVVVNDVTDFYMPTLLRLRTDHADLLDIKTIRRVEPDATQPAACKNAQQETPAPTPVKASQKAPSPASRKNGMPGILAACSSLVQRKFGELRSWGSARPAPAYAIK